MKATGRLPAQGKHHLSRNSRGEISIKKVKQHNSENLKGNESRILNIKKKDCKGPQNELIAADLLPFFTSMQIISEKWTHCYSIHTVTAYTHTAVVPPLSDSLCEHLQQEVPPPAYYQTPPDDGEKRRLRDASRPWHRVAAWPGCLAWRVHLHEAPNKRQTGRNAAHENDDACLKL